MICHVGFSHLLALHQHHPTSAFIFGKSYGVSKKNKNTSHHKRCNLPQLRALRAPRGRVVIFSNLRLTADSLAHQLKREGMTCRHLHGKLDQDRGRMCVVGLVVSSVF